MSQLMLINPGRRVKRRKHKARAGARKKRHMSALQLKYFGKKSQRSKAVSTLSGPGRGQRKGNPVMAKKHKKRRKSSFKTHSLASVRRRTKSGRHRNPVRALKHHRRYRRNPSMRGGMQGFMKHTLMPSAMGAAGALGIDVILGFLPIPVQFKTGPMRALVKIAGAVGIGMVAQNFVKKETANQFVAGAITVTLYDVFKGYLQTAMPTVALSEAEHIMQEYPSLGYANPALNVSGSEQMGVYMPEAGMGVYVGDDMSGE